jgi:regulator of sirC expression with transglutaminase-like and TPR domain
MDPGLLPGLGLSYDTKMNLDTALTLLSQNSAAPLDLATLALQLARDEYPNLDVEACLSELEGMAHEARHLMHGPLVSRLERFCRFLFHDLGFTGDTKDYYDPRNSYLNEVLDRRTGLPITLSIVAICVGQRAGLTVQGVGLPGHFIAKLVGPKGQEILFDPFHAGRVLTVEQCEHLVQEVIGTPFSATPESLKGVPLASIIVRMMTNLKGIYLKQGDFKRGVRVIGRLLQLNPKDITQFRDLGASLLQGDQPGRAIDALQTYLDAVPAAEDAVDVRGLLDKAKGAVSRWN